MISLGSLKLRDYAFVDVIVNMSPRRDEVKRQGCAIRTVFFFRIPIWTVTMALIAASKCSGQT